MSRAAVDVTHVRYPFVLPKFNPEGLLQRYIYMSYVQLPQDLPFVYRSRYVPECLVFLLILSPIAALHQESILGACAWTHPAHICSCSIAL